MKKESGEGRRRQVERIPKEERKKRKTYADISGILDAGAESAEASGTWWEMMSALEADLPEEWAILLLASPDWDLRS